MLSRRIAVSVAAAVLVLSPSCGRSAIERPVPPAKPVVKQRPTPVERGRSGLVWDMHTAWGESGGDGATALHAADVPVLSYTPMSLSASAVQWRRPSDEGDKAMMVVGDRDGINGMLRLFDDETPGGSAQPNVGVQLHPKGDSFLVGGNVGVGTKEPTTRLDIDSDAIRVRRPRTMGSLGPGEQGEIVWARDDAGGHYIYVNVDGKQWKGVELTLSEPATR